MIIYTEIKIVLNNDKGGCADGSGDDDGHAWGMGTGSGGYLINKAFNSSL